MANRRIQTKTASEEVVAGFRARAAEKVVRAGHAARNYRLEGIDNYQDFGPGCTALGLFRW